jgi:hypothetical protein
MSARTILYRAVAVGVFAAASLGTTAGIAQAMPVGENYCAQLVHTANQYSSMARGFVAAADIWFAGGYFSLATQNYNDALALVDLSNAALDEFNRSC